MVGTLAPQHLGTLGSQKVAGTLSAPYRHLIESAGTLSWHLIQSAPYPAPYRRRQGALAPGRAGAYMIAEKLLQPRRIEFGGPFIDAEVFFMAMVGWASQIVIQAEIQVVFAIKRGSAGDKRRHLATAKPPVEGYIGRRGGDSRCRRVATARCRLATGTWMHCSSRTEVDPALECTCCLTRGGRSSPGVNLPAHVRRSIQPWSEPVVSREHVTGRRECTCCLTRARHWTSGVHLLSHASTSLDVGSARFGSLNPRYRVS